MSRYRIHARRLPDGELFTVVGRDADTLEELAAAGERGLTPIEYPPPRWSHYVFKMRRMGFEIETVEEPHGGIFAGTHARYVLRSEVEIRPLENDEAAA